MVNRRVNALGVACLCARIDVFFEDDRHMTSIVRVTLVDDGGFLYDFAFRVF